MRHEHREKNGLSNRIFIRFFAQWMRWAWNRIRGSRLQANTESSESLETHFLNSSVEASESAIQQPEGLSQQKSSSTVQSPTRLFSILPEDILTTQILPRLQLQVKIFKKEPTAAEKEEVLAFNAYHLIVDDVGRQQYRIGFCKKSSFGGEFFFGRKIDYVTGPLDEKGSIFRLMTESRDLLDKTDTQDLLVIACVEQEIQKAGGLLRPVGHILHQCRSARIPMRKATREIILKDALDKLLHHVAYGEQVEAEKILKWCPELLLSTHKGSVTDCSRVRTFLSTTAFQLAVRNGDWHMWQMMLETIPENRRPEFETDLQRQLEEQKQGLEYQLDNLNWCGLRVLETSPSEEQKKDVIARHAYHLILQRDSDENIQICSIGFRNSKTQEYESRELSETSELKKFVRNRENTALFQRESRFHFLVMRNPRVLALAREEMRALGELTEEKKRTTLEDDLDVLKEASMNLAGQLTRDASRHEIIETWCVWVGWAARLLPANLWQWLMNPNVALLPVISSPEVFQADRPASPTTAEGCSWLPLSSSFGCTITGVSGTRMLDVGLFPEFFLHNHLRELLKLREEIYRQNLALHP